jgi:hypothetical protein
MLKNTSYITLKNIFLIHYINYNFLRYGYQYIENYKNKCICSSFFNNLKYTKLSSGYDL